MYSYTPKLLQHAINRANIFFGGRNPGLQNVIFVNGDVDPWHRLSVLDNLNEYTHSILITGTKIVNLNHICFFL